MSYEAFSKGFYGYLNLKEAGKIYGNALLTICDFNLSSNTKRLWVIDIARKKVLFNSLVAHGSGSGEEFPTRFSNTPDSHTSSLGFYTTAETYQGENGYSLKLHGQDGAFNSKAFDRAIVIHGADYVSTTFAANNNRIGRSHGCPALPRELTEPIISKIANGSCLFLFHNSKQYLNSSYWLNNTISNLPQEADMLDVLAPNTIESNKWLRADNTPNLKPEKKLSAGDPARIIKNNSEKKNFISKVISKDATPIMNNIIAEEKIIVKPILQPETITIKMVDTIYTTSGKPVLIQRTITKNVGE